ncbi:MAG TPA: hypothetical protein V6D19_15325 [Stenomitos sp.]
MASTQALLGLVDVFPEAFVDPEGMSTSPRVMVQEERSQSTKTQALLDLAVEFPEAFADPEAIVEGDRPTVQDSTLQAKAAETTAVELAVPVMDAGLPAGYELSLSRSIPTFTWGTLDVHLKYSATGLVSLWLVAGKSGTEVQSLCEAICRLANLLLMHQVPVAEIVRQLRGIRGADSEGLGPHRVLGLADLIGKVLQEAPVTLTGGVVTPTTSGQTVVANPVQEFADMTVSASESSQNISTVVQTGSELLSSSLLSLEETNHRMSLCPECGSELQAMNGCSGGACQVCGYSSCS